MNLGGGSGFDIIGLLLEKLDMFLMGTFRAVPEIVEPFSRFVSYSTRHTCRDDGETCPPGHLVIRTPVPGPNT